MGLKFCSDFFWVRDFGKDSSGVDKKRNPGFSFLCQTIVSVSFTIKRKLHGNEEIRGHPRGHVNYNFFTRAIRIYYQITLYLHVVCNQSHVQRFPTASFLACEQAPGLEERSKFIGRREALVIGALRRPINLLRSSKPGGCSQATSF